MAREVEGIRYLTLPEVLQQMQITRQTLWRWRREGHIPAGRRFRDRQVLFSEDEVALIRSHANRIEPISPRGAQSQLNLFTQSGAAMKAHS
jgi:predicted DNA-binding transcriptional regulator AlpA